MTETSDRGQFSRRGLLKSAVGTGAVLVIGFDVFRIAKGQAAAPVSPFRSWIRIDESGVTLLSGRSEMGQGISSALPMVLADELGVDWNDVRVEKAPNDVSLFGDQGTGGSGSVAGSWMGLRQAAAAARTMLVATAAQKWNVAPESCTVKNGVVSHGDEQFKFSELVEGASKLPLPDFTKLKLKKPEDFEIIGTVVQRKDIPSKTDGSAIFGIDVRPPGMLYAMVERCPVFGGKVKSFDAKAAKNMPGVHDVFEIAAVPSVHSWGGIAVVADSTWTAMQARKKLRINWDLGPHANESSESLRTEFRRVVDSRLKTIIDAGNADTAIDGAAKR